MTDYFCFYLQNRQVQTGQTGGQLYSYTSLFSVPWSNIQGKPCAEPLFVLHPKSRYFMLGTLTEGDRLSTVDLHIKVACFVTMLILFTV
jgi:hypothetical protein